MATTRAKLLKWFESLRKQKPATIACDDGNGPYDFAYCLLVAELKKEFDGSDVVRTFFTINEIQCEITFSGSHYCGYVVDDRVRDMSEDDVDYYPHGGWTASWGFDCAHSTDIVFWTRTFPSEPTAGFGSGAHARPATFKTWAFVENELRCITAAIARKMKY